MIRLRIDDSQLRKLQSDLKQMSHNIPSALAAAINRSMGRARVVLPKQIASATTAKGSRVAKALGRGRMATKDNLSASQTFGRDRGIGVSQFQFTAGRTYGVVVQKLRNEPVLRFKRGFMGRTPGGAKHAFYRDTSKPKRIMTRGKSKGRRMHPLKVIYAASASTIIDKTPSILESVNREVQQSLARNIDSQISRFLAKR